MNTNETPPPEGLAPATGSETVPGTTFPKHLLRLVLQIEDTPENRVLLDEAHDLIINLRLPHEKHAILKSERIEILRAAWPFPNDLSTANHPSRQGGTNHEED